jgi:hypothetical protein
VNVKILSKYEIAMAGEGTIAKKGKRAISMASYLQYNSLLTSIGLRGV